MAVVQWPEELILSVMQIKHFCGAEDYQLVVCFVCVYVAYVVYVVYVSEKN